MLQGPAAPAVEERPFLFTVMARSSLSAQWMILLSKTVKRPPAATTH